MCWLMWYHVQYLFARPAHFLQLFASIGPTGEQKTKDMAEAVAKKVGATAGAGLLDFKINDSSMQQFEGVDYRDAEARRKEKEEREEAERQKALRDALLSGMAAAAAAGGLDGERAARKGVIYSEAAVYRALAEAADGGAGSKAQLSEAARLRMMLPPDHRPPARMDPWQLYDRGRIMEICAQEIAWGQKVKEAEDRKRARQQQKEQEADAEGAGAGAGAGSSSSSVSSSADVMIVDDEGDEEVPPFPLSLIDERRRLIAAGFPSWRREHFEEYIKACAKHGRHATEAIVREMASRGKEEAEVERYHTAFWAEGRGEAVLSTVPATGHGAPKGSTEWSRALGRVARGEAQLKEESRNARSLLVRLGAVTSAASGGRNGTTASVTVQVAAPGADLLPAPSPKPSPKAAASSSSAAGDATDSSNSSSAAPGGSPQSTPS